mmetsp:Transcript_17562/g.16787  ORF Transcript_17562/g.16787 Transcript_17562/m.16787 type:complete len:97 (+) Transcript_17562:193-483(+)
MYSYYSGGIEYNYDSSNGVYQPTQGYCIGNKNRCAIDNDCYAYPYTECRVTFTALTQYVKSTMCLNWYTYTNNPFSFFPNDGSVVYENNQYFSLAV